MILLGSLLVTLASSTDVLYSTDACTAWCNTKGWNKGTLLGTAPFCGGSCETDCKPTLVEGARPCIDEDTDKFKISSGCVTGNRSCCCYEKPVDCSGGWGSCRSCEKEYFIDYEAFNGGRDCPVKAGTLKNCCKFDCYGEWQTCDANCKQRFKVIKGPELGGAACPADRQCNPGTGKCPLPPTTARPSHIPTVAPTPEEEPPACESDHWTTKVLTKPHVPPSGCTCKEAPLHTEWSGGNACTFPPTCTEDPNEGRIVCYVDDREASCNVSEGTAAVNDRNLGWTAELVVCKEKETPVQPPESDSDKLWDIDSLDKLKAWCSEAVANCRVCRGEDQDDGTCKVRPRRIRNCKRFHGNAVCDRILGCYEHTKRNGMKRCRGRRHGLE